MAVDAYRRDTAFRDRFNVIHALFQVHSQISLVDLLLDSELETKLQRHQDRATAAVRDPGGVRRCPGPSRRQAARRLWPFGG